MAKSKLAVSRGKFVVRLSLSIFSSVVMLGLGGAGCASKDLSLELPSLANRPDAEVSVSLAAVKKPTDPNPPTKDKMGVARWPGLITIFHGVNWGKDEKYITAIKEADFGASGAASFQIDQVAKQGLFAFVFIWPFEMTDKKLPAKLRDNDAVLGYFMSDRIPQGRWGTWAHYEKCAYAFDPYHPAIVTMSPRAFGGIDRFFPMTRARFVEYYHYHWDGGRSPGYHFVFLEQYRRESAKHGHVPIGRVVETRPEDMRKTSQTVFTSLAYGVRSFRYGGGLFDTNKRDERGVPTPNKYGVAAKKINQAIKAFSPVFETARSVDVFQTPPLPTWGKEAPKDYWVRPAGEHVVMGEFADKKNRYLVLANRDYTKEHEATLLFSETGIAVFKMNRETAKWEAVELVKQGKGLEVKVQMEAGGGELLGVVKKKK